MAAAARIALRTPAGLLDGKQAADLSSAVLLRLDDALFEDLRHAADAKEQLQFVAGHTPKLRLGSRTIDLTLHSDAFRNELYSSTTGSSATDLTFRGLVSHRAAVAGSGRGESGHRGVGPETTADTGDTAGSDAALAALQSSLATYEQEKAAKQANITTSVLYEPTSRFDAARKEKQDRRRNARLPGSVAGAASGARAPLSSSAASRPGAAPALPVGGDDSRLKAMRNPVVHFLAMRPATLEALRTATNVPAADLDNILQKIGKQADGKWQLTDRAYKELDVWNFAYRLPEQRESAVDNAIRAYDRLRLGKTESLWQMLLAPGDRDKGIVLSRLYLNGGAPAPAGKPGFTTPLHQMSPSAAVDAAVESSGGGAAKSTSTPRHATSTADLKKRLLSKNPQKARAAEEAKEKKRRERETTQATATSEREKAKAASSSASPAAGRKPGAAAARGKGGAASGFKSAEVVHSSADESSGAEEGEVLEAPSASQRSIASNRTEPSPVKVAKSTPASLKHRPSTSSDSSDVPLQQSVKRVTAATAAPSKLKAKPSAAKPEGSAMAHANGNSKTLAEKDSASAGKTTPRPNQKPSSNLSTLSPQLQAQHKRTPSTPHRIGDAALARSPLGVARPRNASDVSSSDRSSAAGVQKVRQSAGLGAMASSSEAAARKRQDTVTSSSGIAAPPSAGSKHRPDGDKGARNGPPAAAAAGAASASPAGRSSASAPGPKAAPAVAAVNGVKRKADGSDDAAPAAKQRKADHAPSSSQAPTRAAADGQARAAALSKTTRPAHASPLSSSSSSSAAAPLQQTSKGSRPPPKPQHPSVNLPSPLDDAAGPVSTLTSATTTKNPLRTTTSPATGPLRTAATSLDSDDHTHPPRDALPPPPPTSALTSLTFAQAVQHARDFQLRYYPRYAELHAELSALEASGLRPPPAAAARLWLWHRRLAHMKREIYAGAARGAE